EEEDAAEYGPGGYHPVHPGDVFHHGRYVVLRKLGWGHFSTVWLALDRHLGDRPVALKIVKSSKHYTESALDEIELLQRVVDANPNSPYRATVVSLLSTFSHTGPNGTHVCMSFEILGPNLLTLIRHHHRGIPVDIVKRIVKQILGALAYLHEECGIIHTDLKPENVLICAGHHLESVGRALRQVGGPRARRRRSGRHAACRRCRAAARHVQSLLDRELGLPASLDLFDPFHRFRFSRARPPRPGAAARLVAEGVAVAADDDVLHAAPAAATASSVATSPARRHRRKPKPEPPARINVKLADLGNACWINQHFTSDIQTRQYRSPEAILGAYYNQKVDIWSLACMAFELLTGEYLFDPQPGAAYDKNDDHVAQIIELLGVFPDYIMWSGKYSDDIFTRRGNLKRIHTLRFWKLEDILRQKYDFSRQAAAEVADFLLPMLALDPKERASAREMLSHPWLAD
ncbi:hypothetical protein CXG81DRAFT_3311, partial [Caulochytrium protostelioides]